MAKPKIFAFSFAAGLLALSSTVCAKEFYVGEPVVKNDMQLVPHYLLGIEMDTMPNGMSHGKDAVHLELDVHATKDEKHGFKEDEWIPYLTIEYTVEKTGGFKKTGTLAAMTAGDGPHYANNVALDGDGDYKLTYRLLPLSKAGFVRHIDKETGVPEWWQPFTVSWNFHFPSKEAKEEKE
jgi:periplasmic iron binding protein